MKKILITGASGFIGSRVLEKFKNNKNYKFISLGRKPASKEITHVECDFETECLPESIFQGIDIILHFAAISHDSSSKDRKIKKKYMRINYDLTKEIFEIAKNYDVKSFVFLSSTKASKRYKDKENKSIYSYTKHKSEQYLFNSIGGNMEIFVIRPSIVYGKGMNGFLSLINRLASKGVFIRLPELPGLKSIVHVEDLISSVFFIIDNQNCKSGIYTISDGKQYFVQDLFNAIAGNYTKRINIYVPRFFFELMNGIPFIKNLTRRFYSDDYFHNSSIDNYGFKSKFSLKDINK